MLLAFALGLLSVSALACFVRATVSGDRSGDDPSLPLWARLAMR